MKLTSDQMNLPTLGWRTFLTNTGLAAGTAVAIKPLSVSVPLISHSGSTASISFTNPHRYFDGQLLTVSGADHAFYNGTFQIKVVDANTISYQMVGDPGVDSSGGGLLRYTPLMQRARVIAKSTNTAAVTVGPDGNADAATLSAGDVLELEAPNGAVFDLSNWYQKSSGTLQYLTVFYI